MATATAKKCKKDGDHHVCVECPSTCCTDLAIEIDKPKGKDETAELRWQLHYTRVRVAIAGKQWHLVVEDTCRYLDQDGLCTIYDHRPAKCREHNPPNCERFTCWHDTLISTPEELDAYLAAKKAKKKRKKSKK